MFEAVSELDQLVVVDLLAQTCLEARQKVQLL